MLPLILPIFGCSSNAVAHAGWIAQHGGLARLPDQSRVDTLGQPLAGLINHPVQFQILDTPALAAFSFSDGSIFISRGLLACATDDELSAAIAHELGHLLDDGHARTTFTLRALTGPSDVEARADALGCQLLTARRIPTSALATLLQKVASTADPATAQDLHRRITILQSM